MSVICRPIVNDVNVSGALSGAGLCYITIYNHYIMFEYLPSFAGPSSTASTCRAPSRVPGSVI